MNSYKVMALLAVLFMTLGVMVAAVAQVPGANGITTPPSDKVDIKGYVTDAETKSALAEVEVSYYEYYEYVEPAGDPTDSEKPPADEGYEYWTYTDKSGYYALSVPQTGGEIAFYLKGYERYGDKLELEGSGTLWLNVTLKEIPPPPKPALLPLVRELLLVIYITS